MTKTILTIAGSDTLAGGGLQSDLKAFDEYGIFGLTAITCLAVVRDGNFFIHDVPLEVLSEQLNTIQENYELAGIKLGLIHDPAAIPLIKRFLQSFKGPIVLDPVLAFKETDETSNNDYKLALIHELFPLATLVTPNLAEAELLSGQTITDLAEMKAAAKKIYQFGPKVVVIKGGDRLAGATAFDLFYDGQRFEVLAKPKLAKRTINGAGCTLASAITANLVLGAELFPAIEKSKAFVYQGIKNGVSLKNGEGNVWHGPKNDKGGI